MGQQIKVRGQKREEPNLHLYVLALIALAQELASPEEPPAADKPETRIEEVPE